MHIATADFFVPRDEFEEAQWTALRQHYSDVGMSLSDDEIVELIYGGRPITELFEAIQFQASDEDIENLRATIRLLPSNASDGVEPLELRSVSMRQFLVAGLPKTEWLPWDGTDHWPDIDTQYRLELCHSEISRWSILFKDGGDPRGDADIVNGDDFDRIELVNNCTSTSGFEFKLTTDERLFHGSFGRQTADLANLYTLFSRRQAGSLAHQSEKPLGEGHPKFFKLYDRTTKNDGWDTHEEPYAPRIDLTRYQDPKGSVAVVEGAHVEIDHGPIEYDRWGTKSEYFTKPHIRKLVYEVNPPDATPHKNPPRDYAEIQSAQSLTFPNFTVSGVYALYDPQTKSKLSWLYELTTATLRRSRDGLYDLELLRPAYDPSKFELRRIVFGGLPLADIDSSQFWTMNRFGYGARPNTMDYDPSWRPPYEQGARSHYGYVLGGIGSENNRYVLPEAFGVERAIFSWANGARGRKLAVDLIGFERILPIWKATIDIQSVWKD